MGDDFVGGDFLGFGFVGEADAVTEDVGGEFLHEGWGEVVESAEPGEGATGLVEGEGGAGRGAEVEVAFTGAALFGQSTGAADERENVALDCGRKVNAVDLGAEGEQFFAAGRSDERGLFCDLTPTLHHLGFFLGGRVIDDEFEEETVRLGLGERVRALLLDGVLGGHHEKRLGQLDGLPADGHLPLLHGFEEGGLDLGGGAVDFVGEDEVGEDGAAVGGELASLRLKDHGARDVAREEVGGELDAFEVDAESGAEGADEERLREAGHAFEEDVAVGEEGDEQPLDSGVLTDDGFANFSAEFLGPSGTVEHEGGESESESESESERRKSGGSRRRLTRAAKNSFPKNKRDADGFTNPN